MAVKKKNKTEVLNCRVSPELKAFIESIVEVEGLTISDWAIEAYKNAIKKYSDYISTAPKIKFHKLHMIYSQKREDLIKKGSLLPGQKPRYQPDEKSDIDKMRLKKDSSLLSKKEQETHHNSIIVFKVTQKEYEKLREASEKNEITVSEFMRRAMKKAIENPDFINL